MKMLCFILVLAILLGSDVGMYFYANSVCLPEEHTLGFCSQWILQGMLLIVPMGWVAALIVLTPIIAAIGTFDNVTPPLPVFPARKE